MIKYIGAAFDHSGYGEAARHDIAALTTATVPVTLKAPRYVMDIADFGAVGEVCKVAEQSNTDYKVIILHTTPDTYPKYFEEGKYHIGRAFWETDKLPEDFAKPLSWCDEIWTGSEYNAAAIRKAGVNKPIYIIPQAIDVTREKMRPYQLDPQQKFRFYSIFEWTERKNPKALLKAFYEEFQNEPEVALVLKTYVDNFTPSKKQEIRDSIAEIKQQLGFNSYPEIYLYMDLMDRDQIWKFHNSNHCFISAHRGEGWGIPQVEALLAGNPIISTGVGGIHEYLKHKENALLAKSSMVQVTENTRNKHLYLPDQKWAEVDPGDLRALMRWVYAHQVEARRIGLKGKDLIEKKFNLAAVGSIMKERIEKIYEDSLH